MQCVKCKKNVYANELCVCGEKAPKMHNGAVRANSIVCFILLFISVLCLILTLSFRTVVNDKMLTKSIEEVELADIKLSDGQKLDEYIYNEFVDDERITVENVDNLLAASFIKDFLIEKVEAYQSYALAEADAPYITVDDIIKLIENNEELLYEEAGLRFLDQDKADLRAELTEIDEFEDFTDSFLDSYFGARLIQTFFSYANVVFTVILLVVIYFQWFFVYKVNSRRICIMLIEYGLAMLIPSVLVLAGIISLIIAPSLNVVDIIFASAKYPFIINASIMLFIGVLFTVIGAVTNKNYKKSRLADKNDEQQSVMPTVEPPVCDSPDDSDDTTNEISDDSISDEDVPEIADNTCKQCSYVNRENASFCSRCGTKLK